MVEPHQAATAVDDDPDGVEAVLERARAAGRVDQVGPRHLADLAALGVRERVPRASGTGPACLDLAEDQRRAVERDDVDLAEARAVVARDDLQPAAHQVLRSEVLDAQFKGMRNALQNASSIASLLLTTEALVSEIPEEKKDAPQMPHGGGMGGMY